MWIKKKSLLSIMLLFSIASMAQFHSSNTYKLYRQISATQDTVYVMMFNGILPATDITYDDNVNSIKWYTYTNPNVPISTGTSEIYHPEDATGYIADVNGKKYNIWVIDYKNYAAVINSITPHATQEDECSNLKLDISSSVPDLNYKTPTGKTYKFQREFTLKYATQKWAGSQLSGSWSNDSIVYSKIVLPQSTYTVTVPLIDTYFRIFGDQFANDLGLAPVSYKSAVYSAVAVECHITTVVTERKEKNEDKRPTNTSTISFSVPFDVDFSSNPNLPVPNYYKWEIYKDKQLIITRTDKDQRYTFNDYGEYNVKVTVNSNKCSYTDSVTVSARIGAALEAPQVFTPDGNGINDEFRILYKSLLSFDCWIYNRWGRLVYHWNDPQKGWDGKIGGKDAAEGVYFWVVQASGYGLNPRKPANVISSTTKKGNVTLLRKHE